MVEIKKIDLVADEYEGVDIRTTLEPFQMAEFKLTTTNKCYVKEIPGGTSKRTGKPYSAFKTYSIKAETGGKELYVRLPNGGVAGAVEEMSVGDTVIITCVPHPKGKSFVVEKKAD